LVNSDNISCKMWRLSKYFLYSVFLVVSAGIVAGSILALYYQDEVRQYMINEINRHVDSEITAKDISFSVLRKFPQASIEFKDVFIGTSPGFEYCGDQGMDTDTLFTAESVFLQFSIRDIFRKQYKINRILAVNGVLNMAVNAGEKENFRIWKTGGQNGNDFTIDLNDVRITGYRVKYSNCIKQVYIDTDLKRLEMKGNFNGSYFNVKCLAQGKGHEFRQNNNIYKGKKELSISVVLNGNGKELKIHEGKVDLPGTWLAFSGKYEIGEPGYIDIALSGRDIDVSPVVSLLEQEKIKSLELYRIKGKFDFTASVSGRYGNGLFPVVTASFNSGKVDITRVDTGMNLTNVELRGSYSNGGKQNEVSSVVFNHFSARFGKGHIWGKGTITNFRQPLADLDINAVFLLEELAEFYKPDNILRMGGKIETDFSIKGIVPSPFKFDIEELYKMDLKGRLKIEKGLLEISRSKHIASGISGMLYFGKTLQAENLDFKIGSDHLSISGTIENGLPWLLNDNEMMNITGSLYSASLNLDKYIVSSPGIGQGAGKSEQLLFPSNLELSLDFLIDDMWFGKFNSTKFKGKLSYKPRMMILNAIEFVSMDGNISGNGVIAQRHNNEFILQSRLQMQNVDIQKMFLTFNNFGQTFIHGEHLNGILGGNIGLICEWTPELAFKWEKLIADSKVEIRNGELTGFEPMLGLARFIHVSELNNIRFSTLNNEIFIRNQVVTIPQMDVNSSAFNLSGSGTHQFDGHFDYRVRVLLSDVLYGKAREAKPENHKFGIIEDDRPGRTGLHLLISGTHDNYKVSYDHRTMRDVIRQNIASERRIFRQLLNEEFGWFSGNGDVQEAPAPPVKEIIISWDEEDQSVITPEIPASPQPKPDDSPAVQPVPGKNEKKFQIIWDEEEKPGN
jgi:hypothetical protein